MVIYSNYIYCHDNFAIYTNIESLCYTSETNTMLFVNCILIKTF